MVYGIIDIVGGKGTDCWICRGSVIVMNFVGVKFSNFKE